MFLCFFIQDAATAQMNLNNKIANPFLQVANNSTMLYIIINKWNFVLNKLQLKDEIINSLKQEGEIEKIIIFGSFLKTDYPNDVDIAVVQNSTHNYLELALKYRKLLRNVSKEIALDIIPILSKSESSFFRNEIENGETIYAR